jgi:hypothetical protein
MASLRRLATRSKEKSGTGPFPSRPKASGPFSSGTEPTKRRFALNLPAMTDEWNEKLRCPSCGKTGMASLSQGDRDDMPTVHSVPDGFKAVQTEYGPDFRCGACDVPVDP